MNQIEIIPIFPTPLVKVNLNRDFTKDELQFLFFDVPMRKDEEREEETHNHQSKDYYLFDSHVDTLGEIKKFCEHHLKLYLEEIDGVDTDLTGLRITQSWLNKNKPGESHHMHYHPNSYLSGVVYITCLPNDSINFENRLYGMFNNIKFPTPKITMWNANGISHNVTEGDLVLFPSWVSHYVNRNETKNRERISLSFNTFPIGEMGDYDGATQLKL
jgi:uncharacterized protein (TIGR02466 family)